MIDKLGLFDIEIPCGPPEGEQISDRVSITIDKSLVSEEAGISGEKPALSFRIFKIEYQESPGGS